jgi:hypothetical protein
LSGVELRNTASVWVTIAAAGLLGTSAAITADVASETSRGVPIDQLLLLHRCALFSAPIAWSCADLDAGTTHKSTLAFDPAPRPH